MTLRLLRIKLDTQQTSSDMLPEYVEHQFLGGRGAATWLLAAHVPPVVVQLPELTVQ